MMSSTVMSSAMVQFYIKLMHEIVYSDKKNEKGVKILRACLICEL